MSPVRQPGFSLDAESPKPLSPDGQGTRPARKRAGFFVPLDPDTGQIDMSRAKPEQLATLQAALGTKPTESTKPDKPRPQINPEFIPYAYTILELAIQQVGKLLLKWPPAMASEMYFADDKKQKLIAPTKELVDKIAPMWVIENQAVIAWAAAFGDAINDMVQKGSERYMAKVLRGEAPPPPGLKLEFVNRPPAPAPARVPTPTTTAPVQPPAATAPPANGAAAMVPDVPVGPAGVRGFVPTAPVGVL